MALSGRLRHRLVPPLSSERGQALPTALFAMIASFALASAAVMSSVDVQQGSARDHGSKEAIAAADAGAGVALLRLNRFQSSLTQATPCVGPSGEAQTPSGGWCPATPAESVGGSTFSYQVSAYEGEKSSLVVVAVGTSGSVSRRIEVGLASYTHSEVFANEQLIGQSNIELNGNATLNTSIGTNGSVKQGGNDSTEVCGNARIGVGQVNQGGACKKGTYEVTEGNKNLPAIVPPEELATKNDDCRLVPDCTDKTKVDTYTKSNPWEPGSSGRQGVIDIGQNATLTMGGEDYFVCKLIVKNGTLYIGAGTEPLKTGHVRIFVDTPEHCGLSAGATQVEVTGNANINSTGFISAEGKYEVPTIYVLGSPTVPTRVKLCGNSGTNELILYAPYSDIEMCGNATWTAMIAGKSLTIGGNPTIEHNPSMPEPALTVQSLWERTHYVECTGASASPPNASC